MKDKEIVLHLLIALINISWFLPMDIPQHPPPPLCRDDFEIVIICALPLEFDAVCSVLDGYWNDDGDPYGKVEGDQNTYTTGWIGKHNVVLTLLSGMGKVSATSVATSFSLSYPRVQLALLVGICGGIPKTSDGTEIVLGDVVVSEQLVQYDFGKRYPDVFTLKDTDRTESPCTSFHGNYADRPLSRVSSQKSFRASGSNPKEVSWQV
jgi:hypothetical protein